tara:strand:+ start:226 stop:345 length:120 start_codon:yes stop_codon:yes gene_type:complete
VVYRLNWEASDGKKREEARSSIPDFKKADYFLYFAKACA